MRGAKPVTDRTTRRPFPRRWGIAENVARKYADRGLLVVPDMASTDRVDGDKVVLEPPYMVTHDEIDTMVSILGEAIRTVQAAL